MDGPGAGAGTPACELSAIVKERAMRGCFQNDNDKEDEGDGDDNERGDEVDDEDDEEEEEESRAKTPRARLSAEHCE